MRKGYVLLVIALVGIWLLAPAASLAQTSQDEKPVVRAVLFYSPSCPHCHEVITNELMPMIDEMGDQLQIVGIDTSQTDGSELYQQAVDYYQIPDERLGVPTLVVNDVVLVGSVEIPEQFPDIVTEGLAGNGYDWPQIPGLDAVLAPVVEQKTPEPTEAGQADLTSEPAAEPSPVAEATATQSAPAEPTATPIPATEEPTATSVPVPSPTPGSAALDLSSQQPSVSEEAPPPDPVGFAIAGVILAALLVGLVFALIRVLGAWGRLFGSYATNPGNRAGSWIIPILALAGLVVAGYLAYVEVTQSSAVCGPIGECNVVQSSVYARILGVPIAVLGLLNYGAVLLLWVGHKLLPGLAGRWVGLLLLALTGFGTLFSIYLTLLELFVIHAVCAWCMTSAIITLLLMLLVVTPLTSRRSVAA